MVRLCPKFLFLVFSLFVLASCSGSDEQAEVAETNSPVEELVEADEPAPTVAAAPTTTPPEATEPANNDEPEPAPTATPTPEPVIYQDDFATSVAPIFADKCASCHNAGGPGAIHWQLDDASDLVATHEWIASVVQSRYMPPWPASDLSVAFHDNRSLRADEIEVIGQWSAAGAPLDVAGAIPITSPDGVVAIDVDVELGPHEPYQGSTAVADDYRCFIYDPELTEQKWLQAFEFVPDQTQIVHHAIGYLAPAEAMPQARRLSEQDELGGWQCYGGSGLNSGDDLFLGWAPGQLPTQFPEGSGIKTNPGDFIVLQIHYHFDSEAPADESTIRLDWADGQDLDPIEFDEFIGPAEIPCATTETGPLCDRSAALARAYGKYGVEGVLADGINGICGVRPEDFAGMTNGIASSSCSIPIRTFGEIVSVFGHEHEIGSAIRMTLNPGRADERILLDIPNWSFDWQYNYYPTESIVVGRGDVVLLECEWDRSRRAPDLEPAYVLWADGTNDEMCFGTISTRAVSNEQPAVQRPTDSPDVEGLEIDIPDDLANCMADAGVPIDSPPTRDQIDATVDQLFECTDGDEVGQLLSKLISDNFQGLVDDDGVACISNRLSTKDGATDLLTFALDDSTDAERLPVGEMVGDCVALSGALAEFGFQLPEAARSCIDAVGRDLLVQATVDGELPETQTLFGIINPCLVDD